MRESFSSEQFEVLPYPSNLLSGWLPPPGSPSLRRFYEMIDAAEKVEYSPSVAALGDFIDRNPTVKALLAEAYKQNNNIRKSKVGTDGLYIPIIDNQEYLLTSFNFLLKFPPSFVNNDLVGLPFSAFVVGIDPTLAGSTVFGLPEFNERMRAILNDWNAYLGTAASASGFQYEGSGWLSDTAKKMYDFPVWKKDSETLPYWKSWNSFFTRQFLDPGKSRPIASPNSNQVVNCPNDGSLFRWDYRLKRTDVFWFKDMSYSLSDILSSPDRNQQDIIERYGLLDKFEGGYIFQTYLNPYNFHRWWVPVNGRVLFDPITIPGCYFKKLVIPDFGGATTASLPYLVQVNARGLIVFETSDYGHVCCIPLGMSEVSSIKFDPAMRAGAEVRKGQEMGMFNYGGSSFAILYQNLKDKELFFMNDKGVPYPQRPVLPTNSSAVGGNITYIGSQIGVWYAR